MVKAIVLFSECMAGPRKVSDSRAQRYQPGWRDFRQVRTGSGIGDYPRRNATALHGSVGTGRSRDTVPLGRVSVFGAKRRAEWGDGKIRSGRSEGYSDLKRALIEHYWNYFAAARARRAELAANLDHVDAVLRDGALRARAVAEQVIGRARKASGLR